MTALAWTSQPATSNTLPSHAGSDNHLILATGCCDGSVRLLSMAVSAMSQHDSTSGSQLAVQHCGVVRPPDLLNVHCLNLGWLHGEGELLSLSLFRLLSAAVCSCTVCFAASSTVDVGGQCLVENLRSSPPRFAAGHLHDMSPNSPDLSCTTQTGHAVAHRIPIHERQTISDATQQTSTCCLLQDRAA